MDRGMSDDDLRLLLAEVQRFCRKSLQPLVARPERTLDAGQLSKLSELATEFGLLNPSAEAGAGIWEDSGGSGWTRFSSGALRYLARANAGVAFHFHQLALGHYACRRLGVDAGRRTIVCLQGVYGLARCSLARLLKPKSLADEDCVLLQDYFVSWQAPERQPLLFQAAEDWEQLIVPSWDPTLRFCWSLVARDDAAVVPLPHSHGLNETQTWQWQPAEAPTRQLAADPAAALDVYADAFFLNAQALVAIACGTAQQGFEKAQAYAALRRQGGRLIQHHPAVRQMAARAASVLRTVSLLCDQLAVLPVERDQLGTVLAVRAVAHDLLCEAANESLQMLGGAGYACEAGLEKIVRDCNHFRLLDGTPSELRMFLSEWEHGA